MLRAAPIVYLGLLLVCAPAVCPGLLAPNCRAGGQQQYQPPPLLPGELAPEDVRPEPRWRRTAGASGSPAGTTSSGGFARRTRRTASPTAAWEYWWARNRYDFLVFPSVPAARTDGDGGDKDEPQDNSGFGSLRGWGIATFHVFLKGDSARLRGAAMAALARLDDNSAYPSILSGLQDKASSVQLAAVTALGLYSSGRAHHALLHLAGGTAQGAELTASKTVPDDVRALAAFMLALARSKGAEAELARIAGDDAAPEPVRAMAVEGLGFLGGEDCVDMLAAMCQRTAAQSSLAASAATALGRTRASAALPHLLQCLRSKDEAVRQSAAAGLWRAAPPGDQPTRQKLFQCFDRADDDMLGGFALMAAARIGGTEAAKELNAVLARAKTADLPWACLGLGVASFGSGGLEAPAELEDLLRRTSNRSVRSAAALALGLAGCRGSADVLREIAADEAGDARVRGYAALALGLLGDDPSLPVLRAGLAADLPPLNSQCAIALCLLNDSGSIPWLEDALVSSGSEGTKAMAARSLLHLGGHGTARNLISFLNTKWSNELTQAYCLDLISKLLDDQKNHLLDSAASGSNFAAEPPILSRFLDSGI